MNGQRSWDNIASAVIATAGPLVGAGLCTAGDVPAVVPATLAGAVLAGVAVRDRRTGRPWSERAFRLASGLAAAAWTTWSAFTGPWHLANLVAGAGAALFGVFVAPAFVGEDAPQAAQQPGTAPGQATAPTGRRAVWKQRIERIARVQPITITADDDWPAGTGFTLHITFAPESGDSWEAIDGVKHRLGAAAGLPRGCTIGVAEGDIQGTAVMRVPTVYALADDVPAPEDYSPLSIWEDLTIGVNEDKTPAVINLRQASGLIASRRGGGKTNLLKVLIENLLRCRDNLTWIADLNGGGLAVPFMLPYVDGEVDEPPIDWVADTPEKVMVMAEVAAAIAKDRKARYAALTARSGGDLLPVTADLPQITIVVDESAELDGDPMAKKAMESLLKVQRIGRAEAVNVVFSALRPTQDTIPVPVRKQTALKLAGPMDDDTDLGYMMAGAKVRSADLVHPGTFYLRRGDVGAPVRQIKVYRTTPDRIAAVVRATAGERPRLDRAGQQVGGEAYAHRLDALRPWLDRMAGRPETAPTVPAGGHRAVPGPRAAAAVEVEAEAPAAPADRDARRAAARDGLRRFTARMEVSQMPKDQLDDVFGSLVADLRPAAGQDQGDDGLDGEGWQPELLIELARDAGTDGIGPTEMRRKLADRGIKVSMKTINKWVPRYVDEGKLRKLDGGKYAA
ncbi:hypothetical protein ACGF5C_31470 [Micromonospora sp. NPDC047620]|uniref:hypothetical protein n=1 Tax=Micromonospora sp. NPDC047620 TaxID=3364251 RepID=UPI00371F9EEF